MSEVSVLSGFSSLFWGTACLGCGLPGPSVCSTCRATLPRTPFEAWPSPTPAGLARPLAAAPYQGLVRQTILAHKEHRRMSLSAPLSELLAGAVLGLSESAPVLLVPVPSRPSVVRERGFDPMWRIASRAADLVCAAGVPAVADRLLVTRPGLADQAGLSATQRARNLERAFRCRTHRLARLERRVARAQVIVCDDVITTGASARESQRALEECGLAVIGVATVAAVARRA